MEPSTGAQRVRRKWSRKDNADVLRCYFKAIEQPGRGYRQRMHVEWQRIREDRPETEQRLADQVRYVRKNHLFTKVEEDAIQNEQQQQRQGVPSASVTAPPGGSVHGDGMSSDQDGLHVDSHASGVQTGGAVRAASTCRLDAGLVAGVSVAGGTEEVVGRCEEDQGSAEPSTPHQQELPRPEVSTDRRGQDTIPNEWSAMLRTYDKDEDRTVADTLYTTYMLWRETTPTERPSLPTPRNVPTKQINRETKRVDMILPGVCSFIEKHYGMNITEVNNVIYSTARYILARCSVRLSGNNTSTNIKKPKARPQWEIALEQQIKSVRAEVSRLTALSKHPTPRQSRLWEIYQLPDFESLTSLLEQQKAQLLALAARLRRRKEEERIRLTRLTFETNERQYYREMNNMIAQQPEPAITVDVLQKTLGSTRLWGAAGMDKIQGYWLKRLTSTHLYLLKVFSDIIAGEVQMPAWLVEGRTVLLPKTDPPTDNPAKYRPITCLSVMYKTLTSCLNTVMNQHIQVNRQNEGRSISS